MQDKSKLFFSSLIFGTVTLTACAGDPPREEHDHEAGTVTLEGTAITEGLDLEQTSRALEAPEPFERLAILFDAQDAKVLEVAVSADGTTWSASTKPELGFSEEGAHIARMDLELPALFYRYRITDLARAPTFLSFETVVQIPAPADPSTVVEDDADELEEEAMMIDDGADDGIATSGEGLSTRIGNVTVHSRASWGARSPNCVDATTPNRATIHHTVGPTNDSMSPQARLRQIQAFHMFSRGYCDIAYNFLVSRDGRIWRGRGSKRLGAHTANANTGNVGISFIGTYSTTRATNKQMCNTAKLLRWLSGRYTALDLKRADIKGHRQYLSTECPGGALYNQLDTIVRWSRNGCD